jgi:hypothetical protein
MMTRSEFVRRRQKHERKKYDVTGFSIGFGLPIGVLFVGVLFFGSTLIEFASQRLGLGLSDHQVNGVWLALVLGLFLVMGGLNAWDARRRARQAGLSCPACQILLVGHLGDLAVASGRCGRCGGAVLVTDKEA